MRRVHTIRETNLFGKTYFWCRDQATNQLFLARSIAAGAWSVPVIPDPAMPPGQFMLGAAEYVRTRVEPDLPSARVDP